MTSPSPTSGCASRPRARRGRATYGTIINDGDTDVTLVSASVPFDATVEIHETIMGDDGSMQMQEVPEGFVVPAGGSFTLEPGGPHIMLIDIDPADITGTIDVTMVFDDGTEVTVGAPVRSLDDGRTWAATWKATWTTT